MRKCDICKEDCGKYKWCDKCRPKNKKRPSGTKRKTNETEASRKKQKRILPSISSSANTAVLSQQTANNKQQTAKTNSLSVQQLLNGQTSSTTSIASLSSQISMAPVVQQLFNGQSHTSGSNNASLQPNSAQSSMAPVVQHLFNGQTNPSTRPAASELFDAYALSCNKVNELFSQLTIAIHNRDRLRDKCFESIFKS